MARLAGVILIAGGVAALIYAFRDKLSGAFAPAKPAQGTDVVSQVVGTLLGQLNKSLDALRDPKSEERKGLARLDTARSEVFSKLGLTSDPNLGKKHKSQLAHSSLTERQGAEKWAFGAFSAASRSDVREWAVTEEGITVWYEGRSDPWVKQIPQSALNPSAWAIEPVARILAPELGGGTPQRGIGPLNKVANKTLTWIKYAEPAFSDNNPQAPYDMTISGLYDPPTFGPLPQNGGEEGAAA